MGLVMNHTVILNRQPNPERHIVWAEVSIQCQAARLVAAFALFCLRIDRPFLFIRRLERGHRKYNMLKADTPEWICLITPLTC